MCIRDRVYRGFPNKIMAVDLGRLLAMYVYGGVYADADVCVFCEHDRGAADALTRIRADARVTLPETKPMGVSNDFMASPPGNPFLMSVILRIYEEGMRGPMGLTPYWDVMAGTGPTLVSAYAALYPEQVNRLPDYGRAPGATKHWIRHSHQGKSWHQWDGTLMTTVYEHLSTWWRVELSIVGVLAVVLCFRSCRAWTRQQRSLYKSDGFRALEEP